jgi:MFS family permease
MTRNYYLLLSGFFVSTIGDWFYQLALPLLIYELTRSAMSMAVTYGLAYAPFLLLLPLGGVLADRIDRRRFLIVGDLSSAAIVGVLSLLAFLYAGQGWLIWLIYPLAFALASVSPLYHPSFQSYLPELVDKDHLPHANSWMQSAENLVVVLGPLAGGIIIALLGPTFALLIDMFSFLGSALFIAFIRRRLQPEQALSARSPLLEPLRQGFRYVWNSPVLTYGSFLFLGTNFALTLIQANLIFFLASTLHFDPVQIGLTFAFTGIGALGGALVAPRLLKQFQPGRILTLTTLCAGLVTFLLFVTTNIFTISIPVALMMALSTINIVTWFTLRQRTVPGHILGRVIATTRLIAFISVPIAAVVGGALLTSTQNMYIVIGIAALLRTLAGGFSFFTPLWRKAGQLVGSNPPQIAAD